jgi:short subunit dehydrogenase-like uncharacterized protein
VGATPKPVPYGYTSFMPPSFLLYGATGFTGRLIAARAVELGMQPVVAGRNAKAVQALAQKLLLPHAVFELGDTATMDSALEETALVLNCAGPFRQTAMPVVEGCLRVRRHYADITGEVDVFEKIFERHGEATKAGITLLPGAGFDVVPSDCLARHLKKRLPSATKLTLAFRANTKLSPGTARTLLERMNEPGMVRRAGALVLIPAASLHREIDAGHGDRFPAMAIPWGDLATAWRSTRIPDIETFAATTGATRFGLKLSRIPVFSSLLRAFIRFTSNGPSASMRRTARALLWGEVTDSGGRRAATRMETPEPYALTVEAALAAVKKLLAGDAATGAQTPAAAFGSEFVMGIAGVKREDLPGV